MFPQRAEKQFTGGFGPKCPNHGVVLIRTTDPGVGICPISGAIFSYDEDNAEKTKKLKIDSTGKPKEEGDWKVKHLSGEGEKAVW